MIISLLLAGSALTACAPEKLVKITTVDMTPGISTDDFRRKPKVIYRLGNGKTRLEEQPDPAQGLHILSITDAPRVWYINLLDKTGQTAVDDSQPPRVHASVFSGEELPEAIQALEFGCEDRFVADPATLHETQQTSNGVALKHSVTSGKWKVSLAMREGSERPVAAILSMDGKVVTAVRYVGYETLTTIPEGLFTPPPGIAFKQAGPDN